MVLDDETERVGGLADDCEIEAPFAEDRLGLLGFGRVQHHEHALLALGEHHLVGGHALFAAGDFVEIEFDAEIAFRAHFDGGGGEAGGAHILNRDDGTRLHQFEAGLQQEFFGERVANLNGGAFFFG